MFGFDEIIPPFDKYDTQKLVNKVVGGTKVGIPAKVGSKKDKAGVTSKKKIPPTSAMKYESFEMPD